MIDLKDAYEVRDILDNKVIDSIIDEFGNIWYEAWERLIASGIPPITLQKCKGANLVDYKIYGNSLPKSILPSEYEQLGYIEATGTQYLELDYVASSITTTKGTYQLTDVDTGLMLFGSRKNSNAGGLNYAFNWGGEKPYCYYNSFNKSSYASLTEKEIDLLKHTVEKNKNKLYIDGELIHTISYSEFTTPYNMIVFGCNNNGNISYKSKAKIFDLQFYDEDVLMVDLIPCYRKSDNVIGMYDLVTGTFYTNKGTGVFLKGNLEPTPEVPIEIESVGDFDEKTRKYKIPVKVNDVVTNIYLNEPLRKIGDYADYIDFKNQKVIRNVGNKIFDGTEEWEIHTTTDEGAVFRNENLLTPLIGASIYDTFMTHFTLTDIYSTATFINGLYRFAYTGAEDDRRINSSRLYISAEQTTVEDFKSWLSENKPFIMYPLAEPDDMEIVELPNILLNKGTNIIELDTKIPSSYMEVVYYGKGKLEKLEETENIVLNDILNDNTETELDITDTEINQILDEIIGG